MITVVTTNTTQATRPPFSNMSLFILYFLVLLCFRSERFHCTFQFLIYLSFRCKIWIIIWWCKIGQVSNSCQGFGFCQYTIKIKWIILSKFKKIISLTLTMRYPSCDRRTQTTVIWLQWRSILLEVSFMILISKSYAGSVNLRLSIVMFLMFGLGKLKSDETHFLEGWASLLCFTKEVQRPKTCKNSANPQTYYYWS